MDKNKMMCAGPIIKEIERLRSIKDRLRFIQADVTNGRRIMYLHGAILALEWIVGGNSIPVSESDYVKDVKQLSQY